MRKLCQLYQKICVVLLFFGLCFLGVPLLFNYSCYGIQTDSMSPTLPIGTLVYVENDSHQGFELNDIITFQRTGETYTHRIVGIDANQHLLTTKGDANQYNDEEKIAVTQVIGKVMFSLPWLGYILLYLKSVEGIIAGTVMIGLLLLSFLFPVLYKGDEK